MLFIGVDLGTSAVKLLLMDENGKIKKTVSREYPLYFPHPGWSEQKPEDWYIQSMDGLKELLKDEKKEEVAGISLSTAPEREFTAAPILRTGSRQRPLCRRSQKTAINHTGSPGISLLE